MKKIIPFMAIIALLMTACRYDEPVFSLTSPENRLVGYWNLQGVKLNNVALDSAVNNANKPGNYYSFFYDGPMSVTAFISNQIFESTEGEWSFKNKYRELNINFVLRGQRFNYVADINKLSKRELKYTYKDNHGDEWQLTFYKR